MSIQHFEIKENEINRIIAENLILKKFIQEDCFVKVESGYDYATVAMPDTSFTDQLNGAEVISIDKNVLGNNIHGRK